ncbi:uncharacterized protein LOC123317353 [Coccinella septempunctata]|uniref:uncharacterized protein LOC123317353 n=1 Tax=Coccinella septempunctata TaxID=41139 RepID=UPI001D0929C4|nr:uncharacterized protein LOC123317353 [Coccinella septempunctata]
MALNRTIVKGIQLVITLLCLCLHTQSRTSNFFTEIVSITAFAGFLIIIAGFFIGGSSPPKLEIFYAIVGFAFFAAAAYLNFHKFHNAFDSDEKTFGFIKSGLSLLNSVAFLLEAVLVWRD